MNLPAKQARVTRPRSPTRERILDEAERLIATKGVYGFTLKDIANPLDVRVPAIYKHYESRDDVLIAVARRFIALLSQQFQYSPESLADPVDTLRRVVAEFVRFHLARPSYVRLSLIDFATPQGGMEYIRLAAGGAFRSNLSAGPLAPMHFRLRALIAAGQRSGHFRETNEIDFYRLLKAVLLLRLVFPDDLLIASRLSGAIERSVEKMVWDAAYSYIALTPSRL